jgi:hypothetical protein
MRNHVHSEGQKTGSQSNWQYCNYCHNHDPHQKYLSQGNGAKYLLGRPQEIQNIRIAVPDIPMGRREKRKIAQSKNDSEPNPVYSVQVEGRNVRSPRTLHDPNPKKRICEKRGGSKKDL